MGCSKKSSSMHYTLDTGSAPCAKFFFGVLEDIGKKREDVLRVSSLDNPGHLAFQVSSVVLVKLSVFDTARI